MRSQERERIRPTLPAIVRVSSPRRSRRPYSDNRPKWTACHREVLRNGGPGPTYLFFGCLEACTQSAPRIPPPSHSSGAGPLTPRAGKHAYRGRAQPDCGETARSITLRIAGTIGGRRLERDKLFLAGKQVMKGDKVEIMIDAGDGVRVYELVATRAGRRVEISSGRGIIEVTEVTRTGQPVRTARFMATRVVAIVEHPASEDQVQDGGRTSA